MGYKINNSFDERELELKRKLEEYGLEIVIDDEEEEEKDEKEDNNE